MVKYNMSFSQEVSSWVYTTFNFVNYANINKTHPPFQKKNHIKHTFTQCVRKFKKQTATPLLKKINSHTRDDIVNVKLHISLILSFIVLENRKQTLWLRYSIWNMLWNAKNSHRAYGKTFYKKHIKQNIIVCEWFCLWCYRSCLVCLIDKSFKYRTICKK